MITGRPNAARNTFYSKTDQRQWPLTASNKKTCDKPVAYLKFWSSVSIKDHRPQPAPYDSLAAGYHKSKSLPIREWVDEFSICNSLPSLKNKSVLDIGCGTGNYAQLFIKRGARSVTGIDISEEMLKLARQQNAYENMVTYRHASATKLPTDLGLFDETTGIFLLHYANDKQELTDMFKGAYRSLKPGGTFTNLVENMLEPKPNQDPAYYRPYDFETVYDAPQEEGSAIKVTMLNKDGTKPAFICRHFNYDTYKAAAESAGFSSLSSQPLKISPEGKKVKGDDFWRPFLQKPPCIILQAKKQL